MNKYEWVKVGLIKNLVFYSLIFPTDLKKKSGIKAKAEKNAAIRKINSV